jgi:hypothetical protein
MHMEEGVISAAPGDFWDRVIQQVAQRIFEREMTLVGQVPIREAYREKIPHMAQGVPHMVHPAAQSVETS